MATTVDELEVLIRAETKGLRRDLNDLNKRLGKTAKETKKVSLGVGTMVKAFAALGAGRFAMEVANTAREFEDLEATLVAVTGSTESAADSFDLIKKFTATTTFQVQNVSTAFTTLLNAGIAPTSETMKDFGNIAAAFGKDITQIAQATFNATTGEMEMLKQFGIKAKLEGDKIKIIFREQETEIRRNSDEIVEYLRNIAQENFSTALEDRAKTATGAISNMKDAIAITMAAVGEGGLLTAMSEAALSMKAFAEELEEPAKQVGQVLLKGFRLLAKAIKVVIDNMGVLIIAVKLFLSYKLATFTLVAATGFLKLGKAIREAKISMLAFNKASKRNLILLGITGIAFVSDQIFDLTGQMTNLLKEAGNVDGVMDPEENERLTKTIEELDAAILETANRMGDDLSDAIDSTDVALGDMREAVIDSSQSFTKDFTDALLDGQNALESFRDFARNIVSQIIAIFLQMEIVNKILNHVFSLTGTNALPTSNILSGMFDTPPNALPIGIGGAGAGPDYGSFAGGGRIQSGMATLVGERGPEIFVPNTGGTILNNMNAKNSMGGGNVVINQSVNFATGVETTVRSEVLKLLPTISEVTKASVMDSAIRGGSFSKAVRGT